MAVPCLETVVEERLLGLHRTWRVSPMASSSPRLVVRLQEQTANSRRESFSVLYAQVPFSTQLFRNRSERLLATIPRSHG